jgi:prepilin peptidase CpaA
MFLSLVSFGLAFVVSAIAAVTDLRTGRIPNALTLPAMAAGIVLAAAFGGASGALVSVGGLFVAGLVPALLYRSTRGRAIGGGDVKLFAALGALLGPSAGIEVELTAFALLSLFALAQLAFRGRLTSMLKNTLAIALRPILPAKWRRPIDVEALTELRMGPAILGGVSIVMVADLAAQWAPWLS